MGKDNVHSAHASAAGYLYQARLALLLGVDAIGKSPNLELKIETLDDISFEGDGDPVELIQTKHHSGAAGALTDYSTDLWKTLRIWTKRAADSVEALPRFILITTSKAPEGSAAAHLRSTDRDEQLAETCLLEAAGKSTNQENLAAYTAFIALNESQRRRLLESILILDQSPNIVDVRDEIAHAIRLAAPKQHIDHFVERLEGWWFGLVVNSLSGSRDAIKVLAIDARIDELREEFHRSALPVDHAGSMPSAEIVADLDKRPFVQQLRKINIGPTRIEYAMRDYYRASEQRARWAREDLLVDGELKSYDRELIEAWEPRFAAMVEELPHECGSSTKAAAGAAAYKWIEQDATFPLRSVAHSFLTKGSYHLLANRYSLGWHPDYLEDAPSKDDEE